ncbi:PRAME family member 12-like [Erinaceus europaeus]|uniref:PRAME family member 12-like n=1 Tax=Erinaceus europaeus TaxID=9365 RepID=A0A1S3AFR4_ERIEU|nr:PRAME family member 12-like [Erinaceus europaeus]
MNKLEPPSLQNLAIESLVRNKELAIDALKALPAAFFPPLFLEAYRHECLEILKAMVPAWPFPYLPLGGLEPNMVPWNPSVSAVLDGIDVLLAQSVGPRRCKLQVLDLRNTGQEFWTGRTGIKLSGHSPRVEPQTSQCSRMKKQSPLLEIFTRLHVHDWCPDSFSSYLLEWVKKRKAVHVCFVKVTIVSVLSSSCRFQYAELLCIKELEVYNTWTLPTLKMFAHLMGKMKNLKKLTLRIHTPAATTHEELELGRRCVSQFTSQFLHLRHLTELYLQSPSFLQGHLEQLLRRLVTPLEILSLTNCTLTEGDLVHLFQSPHISHLKELCLRGVPLTSVSNPLRALLEVNAATLQHLDLGLCGLQDPQLEALLPALSSCSQLNSLSLHGNRLSMATLEKLLRCTSGLRRLRKEIYPAPLESFSSQGTLLPEIFDVLCSQFLRVLRDIGCPRTILVSPKPCLSGMLMLGNWVVTVSCSNCLHHSKKLSFGLSEN